MNLAVALAPRLLRHELRLHTRHGIVAGIAVITGIWIALLWLLPPAARPTAVAWVLFLDVATVGFYFAPALLVVERANGITAALRLTTMSPRHALAVRIGLLGTWALFAALAVTLGGGVGWAPTVLVGATVTAVLLSLTAVVMVGRGDTLTDYLPRIPVVGVPLLAPALAHGTGLVTHPATRLSPATAALELLLGRWSPAGLLFVVLVCAALWVPAERVLLDVRARAPQRPRRRERARRTDVGPEGAVRSFARTDRRSLLGDGMLVTLALGIPLLAVLLRLAAGPGNGWLESRLGVDLVAHLPVLWALVLVFHTPVMAGAITGMLFLEDRDAGVLPAVAVTRAGLSTLVAYRLTAAAVLTAAALMVALPLAGARHSAGTPGVVATAVASAAASLVPALLLAALVRDRVAGMALMKVVALPLYLPLAWWFVDHPSAWAFALVPTGWAARAWWASRPGEAAGFALGAIGCSAAWGAVVLPRLRRRLSD
ncbi:hypothetical protein [Egicoccus sp. AB-alg6-2]|uniref:hypothetical protein n=1 Tax=Egicoccus sp. AB-alg6-2 TaxID=3242692 RepID=UPI00359DEA09